MAIKEKQLPIPTLQQLYNFLSSYRKRKLGSPSISIGSLVVWCEENGQLPPNDEKHRMFVIGYDCCENYFRLFVSTRYLLSFADYSDCIHIDATYKLIWNGYPGLLLE